MGSTASYMVANLTTASGAAKVESSNSSLRFMRSDENFLISGCWLAWQD